MMKCFLVVTNDKYELPLAVCDNYRQLANYTGRSIFALRPYVCRLRNGEFTGRGVRTNYKIVPIELEE